MYMYAAHFLQGETAYTRAPGIILQYLSPINGIVAHIDMSMES